MRRMLTVSSSPYLFCLYAEDVRQEITGQMSIIGAFQGGLRVPSVPAHLPKLAIIANLRMPSEKAPSSVKLEVHRDGEVLQAIDPPPEFLQSVIKQPGAGLDEGYTMQFVVGFAGFPVPAAGKLEVRAMIDGVVLRGNSLEITVGDVPPATIGLKNE
jgi:hypothetical protein